MSRIIQPFGKIVQRMTFEVDVHNKMKVTAVHIDLPTGTERTMTVFEGVMLALGFVRDMISMMQMQAAGGQQAKPAPVITIEGGNGETKSKAD